VPAETQLVIPTHALQHGVNGTACYAGVTGRVKVDADGAARAAQRPAGGPELDAEALAQPSPLHRATAPVHDGGMRRLNRCLSEAAD
jgi:hypothetical protein